MSNLHHRSPVTETLPPFIFIIRQATLPDRYSILLWKNGHYLTVQFPEPSEPPKDLDGYLHSEVGKLQPFASSLVFGKTNWAYFVNNKNDKRMLAYRQKPRSGVQYPPFAPLVHESELTFIRPVQGDLIEGIWRGQQVDIRIGVDDFSIRFIEKQMRAHELLGGLDLTYDILAHVVDSDWNIVGLICEPAFGRPFQASDILALDEAMRKIHERDLFWYLDPDNIMLSLDNKIRLLSYCGVRKFRNPGERENQRLRLQRTLHEIYLSYKSVYHYYSSYRYQYICTWLLDGTLPLEWPLVFPVLSREKLQPLPFTNNSDAPLTLHGLCYRQKNASAALPLAATTKIEGVGACDAPSKSDNEDKPLLRVDRQRKYRHSPYHVSLRKSRKLLLAPEA
ncbi:hypothetical protein F5887DRAFT_1073200 [Amanita rubescens]|nr:hypothetical protein F5887DRAFT_1073200 [Amanita rubescens]